MLRFLVLNYGWAGLGLTLAGMVATMRRDWRDAWALALAGAGTAVVMFLALGAFTPIEMRANLAAHPLVAALAAVAVSWLWKTGRLAPRVVAVAGVAATLWIGVTSLRAVLG